MLHFYWRKVLLFISIIIFVGLLSSVAFAFEYTSFQSAWSTLENDNVLLEMSMGSQKFINKLKSIMSSGNTVLGGLYYTKGAGHGECWGFATAVMNSLFNYNAPTEYERTHGGNRSSLRGKSSFSYQLFQSNNVPQRGATLIRTQGTDYYDSTADIGSGHSMVLLYYDQDYVYVLDANNNDQRSAAMWKLRWEDWSSKEFGKSGNRRIKYVIAVSDAEFNSKFNDQYKILESNTDAIYTVKGVSINPETIPSSSPYIFDTALLQTAQNQTERFYRFPSINSSYIDKPIAAVFHVTDIVADKEGTRWLKIDDGTFILEGRMTEQYRYNSITSVPGVYVVSEPNQTQWGRAPFDAHHNGTVVKNGTSVIVAAAARNNKGSLWYELDYKGSNIWIYSGHVSFVRPYVTISITVDNPVPASGLPKVGGTGIPTGNLIKGNNFSLRGVISASEPIATVNASIINTSTGENAINPVAVKPNARSFDIRTSAINNNILFGKLPDGEYRYIVTVSTVSGTSETVINSTFTVGNGSASTYTPVPTSTPTPIPTTTPTPSSEFALLFENIKYPTRYRIGTNGGFPLSDGTIKSSAGLKSVSTRIVDGNGKNVSGEISRNIEGKSYAIKQLDTFSSTDNGVKFSYIKTTGNYTWILKATDIENHTLTLTIPFKAVTDGSTTTSVTSRNYYDLEPLITGPQIKSIGILGATIIDKSSNRFFQINTLPFLTNNITMTISNETVIKLVKIINTPNGILVEYKPISEGAAQITFAVNDGGNTKTTKEIFVVCHEDNVNWRTEKRSTFMESGTEVLQCDLCGKINARRYLPKLPPRRMSDAGNIISVNAAIIEEKAFSNSGVRIVKLGEGVQSIGDQAFAYCHNLEEIYIPPFTSYISPSAFHDTNESLVIFGALNSYAQTFADRSGILFMPIDLLTD